MTRSFKFYCLDYDRTDNWLSTSFKPDLRLLAFIAHRFELDENWWGNCQVKCLLPQQCDEHVDWACSRYSTGTYSAPRDPLQGILLPISRSGFSKCGQTIGISPYKRHPLGQEDENDGLISHTKPGLVLSPHIVLWKDQPGALRVALAIFNVIAVS